MTKEQIITAIRAFVAQRSGIDFRNYWTSNALNGRTMAQKAFMGDYRPMLRAGRDARALLAYVAACDSITADDIIKATRAYSGRLQLEEREGNVSVDYCTGQYFPTEYRNAACAVLSQAIWDSVVMDHNGPDAIRRWAKNTFGRGIASRWFN